MKKPPWKTAAEISGESLPEYWSLPEISKESGLTTSYIFKLLNKYFIPSYKIGTIRLLRNEQAEIFFEKLKN